ncbi:MAG: class I SAM-dependent methyltransferase [bacterium]
MEKKLIDSLIAHNSNEWFLHAFSDDYLYLYAHRSEEEADDHINLAIQHVPFEQEQNVLDIACGAGRHLLAFAKRGAKVAGIDLSNILIENARKRFRKVGLSANLVHGDMREIGYQEKFDGATMWFTSFGYFESSSEDRKVLTGLSKALKFGGWWWIDLPNPNYLKDNLIKDSERIIEGPNGKACVKERRRIVGSRVVKTIQIHDNLGHRKYVENVRLYTPERFGAMVLRAKLSADGVLGDYKGSAFTMHSPRQIWYGRKLTS